MRRLPPGEVGGIMLRAGIVPLEPYAGARAPWPCLCIECGREVAPRLSALKSGRSGCRSCAMRGNRNGSGATLMTRRAPAGEAIMRAANLEPLVPFPGAQNPWQCRCSRCGKEVTPRLSTVKRGSSGCRSCALLANQNGRGNRIDGQRGGKRHGDGRRVTDERRQAMADQMLEHGFLPTAPYPGVDEPWPAICLACGRHVTPHLLTVRRGGGCRHCTRLGGSDRSGRFVLLASHHTALTARCSAPHAVLFAVDPCGLTFGPDEAGAAHSELRGDRLASFRKPRQLGMLATGRVSVEGGACPAEELCERVAVVHGGRR